MFVTGRWKCDMDFAVTVKKHKQDMEMRDVKKIWLLQGLVLLKIEIRQFLIVPRDSVRFKTQLQFNF